MEEKNKKQNADHVVKEIKRRTRRTFTSEEKIKIVLEALRGEDTIAAICRKYAIHSNNYFKWSKVSRPRKTLHIWLVILVSLYRLI